jgi:hypothetical protein
MMRLDVLFRAFLSAAASSSALAIALRGTRAVALSGSCG